jgi:hypothetical protein
MTDQGYVGDGETLPTTPEEALGVLNGFVETALEWNSDDRPDIDEAFEILGAFIKQVREHGSEDLEWGDPGDCRERTLDDDEYKALEDALGGEPADFLDEVVEAKVVELGLGRHYGDPHCIWCLQAN